MKSLDIIRSFTHNRDEKLALKTILELNLGYFPEAYKGLLDLSNEKFILHNLLLKIPNLEYGERKSTGHIQDDGYKKATLKISVEEIVALINALMLYLGRYPRLYKGADYFRAEALALLERLIKLKYS